MSIQSIWKLYEPGFFKVEPDSSYNPNVLIYQKQDSRPINTVFLESKHNNKGVYILVDTEKNKNGNFKLQIGVAGVSGQATLFDRLERMRSGTKDSQDSPESDKWGKAILIFDWRDDIEDWLQSLGNFREEEKKKLIDVALDSEVYKLEKFLYDELKKIAEDLNVEVEGRSRAEPEVPETDKQRYKYYLEVVEELLKMITKNYINMSSL